MAGLCSRGDMLIRNSISLLEYLARLRGREAVRCLQCFWKGRWGAVNGAEVRGWAAFWTSWFSHGVVIGCVLGRGTRWVGALWMGRGWECTYIQERTGGRDEWEGCVMCGGIYGARGGEEEGMKGVIVRYLRREPHLLCKHVDLKCGFHSTNLATNYDLRQGRPEAGTT